MHDQYVVVLAHVVRDAAKHADQFSAAEEATRAVEKDKVPRIVLRVLAEVRASSVPRVNIVQVEEQARD